MDAAAIEHALHRLGARFAYPIDVELLLVGGAAGMLSGVLPRDWRSRRVWVGMWGRLRVFSIGRSDLVAMKVLAGRPQDVEDLRALRLTGDDVDFVRRYLGTLATGGTHDDEIREALALLAILEEECRGR
jgi:hypothetical protein